VESVILISNDALRADDLTTALQPHFRVRVGSDGRIIAESEAGWLQIYRDDEVVADYEGQELRAVKDHTRTPVFYVVQFRGLETVKTALLKILGGNVLLVDDDHGHILEAAQFVDRLRSDPEWDWRLSEPTEPT